MQQVFNVGLKNEEDTECERRVYIDQLIVITEMCVCK